MGKVMSEMLGHSPVGITITLYSHALPKMRYDVPATLHRLLGG
jgi:hypothetical protein